MLAMIRINLIGTPKKRRRGLGLSAVPNVGILFFLMLLIGEGALLFSWHADASEAARSAEQKVALHKVELEGLKQTKGEIDKLQTEVNQLQKQALMFEELTARRRGPVDALTYLSFALSKRVAGETARADERALEAAGWRVSWNPQRAWFKSIREKDGESTIIGEAIDHEDVAEVLRRLESSAYFREVKLVYQERKHDEYLNADYIDFKIKASLIYLIEPFGVPDAPDPATGNELPTLEQEAAAGGSQDEAGALDGLPRPSSVPVLPTAVSEATAATVIGAP